MELFASDTHFILVDGEESLWFDRQSGSYETKTGLDHFNGPGSSVCLGTVYGFVGKLQISQTSETRLVFIRQHSLIGTLKECDVYKILSVVSIPLESESELLLEPCCKSIEHREFEVYHNGGGGHTSPTHQVTMTDGAIGSKIPSLCKVKTPQIRSLGSKKLDRQEKLEKRMLDEFHKMFTEADSFYYSPSYDITNSVQRQHAASCDEEPGNNKKCEPKKTDLPLWERSDLRFFWNWHMLESLISSKDKNKNKWIIPIIQGFMQSETCHMEPLYDAVGIPDIPVRGSIDLWLISRRSRYQAGTRYLRRGVDELGKVANYVETEQIMIFKSHMISFVQIRGSIPVFWSQPNRYRYRPPPRLERDDEENYNAFRKHFEEEIALYERLVIVNLVEKSGKEKVLGDAYLENIMKHNSSSLTYVTFDFHESWGMKFENVSVLVSKISNIIRTMSYCWIDSYGIVLKQTSTFRVNCVDCLDRTNVVQTHIAREMLNIQLSKLGLIVPEVGLPGNVRQVLQTLWANNGDTISKQYAGTNALKGDFTRTGERRITGVMKDGMNSANRYYLNRFKDASRQAVIDLMLGIRNTVTEADLTEEKQPEEKENLMDQIKMVIEDVKRCAIPPDEIILGSWGLVNAKLNEPDTIDIDAIFILTEKNYYVTEYDCTMDSMTNTQQVNLATVESLELGFDTLMQPTTFWNIFYPGNNSNQTLVPNLRINYTHDGEFLSHDFRSSNIRFFNNVPVPIQQPEEMQEALRMLAEAVKIAVDAQGKEIVILLTNFVPQKDQSKTRLPVMATSWVHRYFTAAPTSVGTGNGIDDNVPLAKKITTASLERFTPKYFRRGSSAAPQTNKQPISVVPTPRTMIISASHNEPDHTEAEKNILQTTDLCKVQLQLATNQNFYPDLIDFNARTPVEGQPNRSHILPVDDIVLASCGIISLPQFRRIATSPIYPSDLIINEDVKSGVVSPVTPMSDVMINFPLPVNILSKPHSLQRHRCSLPTNTFDSDLLFESVKTSKTPEITITEEPVAQHTDEASILKTQIRSAGICRRISRSSEEVNKISSSTYGTQILGIGSSTHSSAGSKLLSLFPLNKNENRSSSQQNIIDSMGHEMRGSHSDNALRENPFQNQTTQKRDLVFAPLGKLARGMQNLGASYLDPRKLRDSFKPVVKKDAVEDMALEERKRHCQTLIINV